MEQEDTLDRVAQQHTGHSTDFSRNDRKTSVATICDDRIQQGCHVSKKYVHGCLAKEGTSAKNKLDLNSMDRDELEHKLYCKHSRHLSPGNQRTVSDRLGKASAKLAYTTTGQLSFTLEQGQKTQASANSTLTILEMSFTNKVTMDRNAKNNKSLS